MAALEAWRGLTGAAFQGKTPSRSYRWPGPGVVRTMLPVHVCRYRRHGEGEAEVQCSGEIRTTRPKGLTEVEPPEPGRHRRV